jgi:hypothetical protein
MRPAAHRTRVPVTVVVDRVLFIAGMGRSGTTVLEQALGQHRDVVVLGETLHLWKRGLQLDELCGCGEPFSGCPFWREIGARAFGGWARVNPDQVLWLRRKVDHVRDLPRTARKQLSGPTADLVREYAWYFQRIHRAAAEVTGASTVVDSSKQISLAFCLSHQPGYDLRVLHCVRDSRAVAHSWSQAIRRPESQGPNDRMPTMSPGVVALKWDIHNAVVPLLRRRGIAWQKSRYEDFAANPVATLRRVMSFAGLDPDQLRAGSLGDGWLELRPNHTVSGNPVRFDSGRVPIRLDERWQHDMPAGRRLLVCGMTWPMLRRYDYPLFRRTRARARHRA